VYSPNFEQQLSYWDHQKELDADIEKRLAAVEKTQQKMKPSKFLKRLKSEGLI